MEIERTESISDTDAVDAHSKSNDHTESETRSNDLAPQTTAPLPVNKKEYSVLIDIEHPCHPPMGAFKYIESGSRDCLLQAVSEIMTAHGPPDISKIVINSLSIRKGDGIYDILEYAHDDVGELLDEVVESEKFPRIKCVYGFSGLMGYQSHSFVPAQDLEKIRNWLEEKVRSTVRGTI
ncbi:hypothetical protein Plec18167_001193 [Paecilomyces lecythidis]|uniref:Uncharacterized protein n=1 Tax=Paecilomyces lecythidis TaxID=3004212 RepID=A0ABR3YBL8_9EURO